MTPTTPKLNGSNKLIIALASLIAALLAFYGGSRMNGGTAKADPVVRERLARVETEVKHLRDDVGRIEGKIDQALAKP